MSSLIQVNQLKSFPELVIEDPLGSQILKAIEMFLSQDNTGHDVLHAYRVYHSALRLAEREGGDLMVIGCSALVHDICRPWEKEVKKSHFGAEALEIIREFLKSVQLPANKIPLILDVVAQHDIFDVTKLSNDTLELKILQDADRLDAMGAVGIARVCQIGGAFNDSLYYPGEDFASLWSGQFEENVKRPHPSIIGHFFEKLLKLKDGMRTETGKQWAEVRHQRMVTFVEDFIAEATGKDLV